MGISSLRFFVAVALVALFSAGAFAKSGSERGFQDKTGFQDEAGKGPPSPPFLRGTVQLRDEASGGWSVVLYAAGKEAAERLGRADSDGEGNFSIKWKDPGGNPVIYLIASRGGGLDLMALLGTVETAPNQVFVNERTTVASVWTAAQFLSGQEVIGNKVGLRTAASWTFGKSVPIRRRS